MTIRLVKEINTYISEYVFRSHVMWLRMIKTSLSVSEFYESDWLTLTPRWYHHQRLHLHFAYSQQLAPQKYAISNQKAPFLYWKTNNKRMWRPQCAKREPEIILVATPTKKCSLQNVIIEKAQHLLSPAPRK